MILSAHTSKQFWNWFSARAYSVHARMWLFVIAATESSVSLIPPDILLFAMVMARPDRWASLAVFTASASVFGGLVGYAIGAFFFDTFGSRLVAFYGLEEKIVFWEVLFRENTFVLLFAGALTPLPYKVFTLLAGVFKVHVWVFLVASILGRLLRYGGTTYLLARYGKPITLSVIRNANVVTVFAVAVLGIFILWRLLF
jgi:membrane protein YqaA with SNARE-associated domain